MTAFSHAARKRSQFREPKTSLTSRGPRRARTASASRLRGTCRRLLFFVMSSRVTPRARSTRVPRQRECLGSAKSGEQRELNKVHEVRSEEHTSELQSQS